jgi:hypothetical protein
MRSTLTFPSCCCPAIPMRKLSFGFSDKIHMQQLSLHSVQVFVLEVKQIRRNRIFNFHRGTVHSVWHVLRNEIRLVARRVLVRWSPVKASNLAHLTKSFCTIVTLRSSRVLFRVTAYRAHKTFAMATNVQTNFSEIRKHILGRGSPLLYAEHIGLCLIQNVTIN